MSNYGKVKHELEAWTKLEGITPSVLLQLSDPLRSTLKRIMRQGAMTFDELGAALELSSSETEEIADLLVDCGFLKTSLKEPDGRTVYSIRHTKSHRPEAPVAVWRVLMDERDETEGS